MVEISTLAGGTCGFSAAGRGAFGLGNVSFNTGAGTWPGRARCSSGSPMGSRAGPCCRGGATNWASRRRMGAILARHLLLIASIIPRCRLESDLAGACFYTGFGASQGPKLGPRSGDSAAWLCLHRFACCLGFLVAPSLEYCLATFSLRAD